MSQTVSLLLGSLQKDKERVLLFVSEGHTSWVGVCWTWELIPNENEKGRWGDGSVGNSFTHA